jgi:HD-like signal output (HDOD) protein
MAMSESSTISLDSDDVDDLVASIHIPPRPSLLVDLQCELDRTEPNLKQIAHVVEKDTALSGAFLKTVNSAVFRCARKVETVEDALARLGLNQTSLLAGGFLARRSFGDGSQALESFWEKSTLRSTAMAFLARELRAVSADLARCFGLFADLGIPILMERFSAYTRTLALAQTSTTRPFTEVEDEWHRTNHATIGAVLARNWKLPDDVVDAIALHHDYGVFGTTPSRLPVRRLIALGVISDIIIQRYQGQDPSVELNRAEPLALDELGISTDELDDLGGTVHDIFNHDA